MYHIFAKLLDTKLFTILILKFEQIQFTTADLFMCLKIAGWVANSVDPD